MADLHDRFRIAQGIPAPDLWVDIQARLTVSDSADKRRLRAVGSPTNRHGSLHKWLTIAAAFAIAVPAIALSVRVFREAEPSVSQNHRVSKHVLSVTEYPVPSIYGPGEIAAGSDGGAWFTLPDDDSIGRITSAGSVVTFELPGSHLSPNAITPGSGGSAWFTEEEGGGTGCPPNYGPSCPRNASVGHIDASGAITEYPLPSGMYPTGIAMGADGNLWVTGVAGPQATGWIGRMTPSGTVTSFPLRLHNQPMNIVAGPDGALWFTEDGIWNRGTGAIGRLTTSGSLTEFVLPTSADHRSGAGDIAVGPDGNLWFTWVTQGTGQTAASIGRITPSGTITRFPVSGDHGWPPGGIAAGRDGSLWFTLGSANAIGRILVTGTVTLFRLPTGNSFPSDIATGSHGGMWFTDSGSIGRFNVRDTSDA
jgi:streptogramin lyase